MLTVNELVDRSDELNGKPVEVLGLLSFGFEDRSLQHFPKEEQRETSADPAQPYCVHPSSVWLAFGCGSIQANEDVLKNWDGKRVRVTGIVRTADAALGCGHLGGWPCEIASYTIEPM